jgi:hypothetical protein
LYYVGYKKPESHPALTSFIQNPLDFIYYILAYLGSSLSWKNWVSIPISLLSFLMIGLAIFSFWRFDKQRLYAMAPWLVLALYSCMAACVTALGRAGFGWKQALASRYTTISFFLPLCAIILFWCSIKLYPKKLAAKIVLYGIITILFLGAYSAAIDFGSRDGKIFSRRLHSAAFALTYPEMASDLTLRKMFPKPEIARERIKILKEIGIKFKTE